MICTLDASPSTLLMGGEHGMAELSRERRQIPVSVRLPLDYSETLVS
jgi:hypothetical protein